MDGDAPAEVEGCGELAEDGEQAGAQQHGGVAKPPLHGAASSMPAHGSARVVVDGMAGVGRLPGNTGQVVAELKVVTSNKLCEPIL